MKQIIRFFNVFLLCSLVSQIGLASSCYEAFSASKLIGEPKSALGKWGIKYGVDPLIRITKANEILKIIRNEYPEMNFWEAALKATKLKTVVSKEDLTKIPGEGKATLVYANHPTGFADGIALGYIMEVLAKRNDVKVLYNNLLSELAPELKAKAIELDILSSDKKARAATNKKAIEDARKHLENGGALVVFPAGEVSTIRDSVGTGGTYRINNDSQWKDTYVKLIADTGAIAVPFYSDANPRDTLWQKLTNLNQPGNGSKRWHSLAWLQEKLNELATKHPKYKGLAKIPLRMAAMVSNYSRLIGQKIEIKIGDGIDFSQYVFTNERGELNLDTISKVNTALRNESYALSNNKKLYDESNRWKDLEVDLSKKTEQQSTSFRSKYSSEIKLPTESEYLGHLTELIENKVLQEVSVSEGVTTYYAPNGFVIRGPVLNQLGAAREISFAKVGEGSGKEIDLDIYDNHYVQFLTIHNESKKIVAAYRMGRLDQIIAEQGIEGVYGYQFFGLKKSFYDSLPGKTLEMGRSFSEKEYAALAIDMTWKGIAFFLKEHPEYVNMLGPVSMSQGYTEPQKLVMAKYYIEKYPANKQVEKHAELTLSDAYNIESELQRLFNSKELSEEQVNKLNDAIAGGAKGDKMLNSLLTELAAPEAPEAFQAAPPLMSGYGRMFAGQYFKEAWNHDREFKTIDALVLVQVPDIAAKIFARYVGDLEMAKAMQEQMRKEYPEYFEKK